MTTNAHLANFEKDTDEIAEKIVRGEYGQLYAQYGDYELHGAFHPIFENTNDGFVSQGHEGLIRPILNGESVNPVDFFQNIELEDCFYVDRLCRALHIHNFSNFGNQDEQLYLNLDPSIYDSPKAALTTFDVLIDRSTKLGVSPDQLVFELVETPDLDPEVIQAIVTHLKSIGVSIAIDNFGVQSSNYHTIFEIQPDVIKFHRSWLQRGQAHKQFKRLTTGVIRLFQELGSVVVIQGIESDDDVEFAVDCGADRFQGYFFGTPSLEFGAAKVKWQRPRDILSF
jgi:EAL domain-containing protein (putative c-di-GMP-specific phosphodiesterase class I)